MSVLVGSVTMMPVLPSGAFLLAEGYLIADGSSLLVADYTDLHTAIGYLYGGAGLNFNIPDLRGRFCRFVDGGAGRDPQSASRTNRGDGNTGNAVGTKQVSDNGQHTHSLSTDTFAFGLGGFITQTGDPNNPTNIVANGGLENRPKNITVVGLIKY